MAHTVYDLYELMPKKDCGLCGNPSCRTSARKIATGDISPEKCVNLRLPDYKRDLERIERILKEGVEVGAKCTIVVGKEGIAHIHPCISEARGVTVETKLTSGPEGRVDNLKYGFFDPFMMCWALDTSGLYKDVRCSTKLGVARINIDGKTIMVFQDGRINVRKAKDKNDAIQTIRLVSRSLWVSIICSCCGNAGVDCASGGCDDCLTRVCPVLASGPPDLIGPSKVPTGQTTGSTIFDRAKKLETGKYFEKGFRDLDDAIVMMKKAGQGFLGGRFNYTLIDSISGKLAEANNLAIRFVVGTPHVPDATIGLILAGVVLDITRMSEGLAALIQSKKPMEEELRSLFINAVNIAEQAYQSLRTVNHDQAKQITGRYMKFRKEFAESFREKENRDSLVAIEKIATNGFYITRLLTKPLPT